MKKGVSDLEAEALLADVIQKTGDLPEGAMLHGYLIVAEYETLEGDRYFSWRAPTDQRPWTTQGYAHYFLEVADDEDDDEEES